MIGKFIRDLIGQKKAFNIFRFRYLFCVRNEIVFQSMKIQINRHLTHWIPIEKKCVFVS